MPDCLPWQKSLDSCLRLSHLHNQIKRHGYNALGDRSFAYWDSDEVVVYHSARVIAVSVHKLFRGGDEWEETCSLSGPIDLQVLKFISENAQEEEQRLQSGRLARCSA